MTPDQLKDQVRAAAVEFTDQLIVLFAQAFASVANDFASGARQPMPAARRASAPVRTAAPKAMPLRRLPAQAEDKRTRRTAADLDQVGERVVNLLASNRKGLRVEQINRALGTSTRDLMRPIQKLLSAGRIRKSGERRATTYFVA